MIIKEKYPIMNDNKHLNRGNAQDEHRKKKPGRSNRERRRKGKNSLRSEELTRPLYSLSLIHI